MSRGRRGGRAGVWVVGALALACLAQWGCESTGPVSDCIQCRCECQGGTGIQTTTFESHDSAGNAVHLNCTLKGDCVAECARIGAPTALSANCLATH
jgi:hypothetical protein